VIPPSYSPSEFCDYRSSQKGVILLLKFRKDMKIKMQFEIEFNNKHYEIELQAEDEIFTTVKLNGEELPDYLISNYGRLYSFQHSAIRNPRYIKGSNAMMHKVYAGEKRREIPVHRLVAFAYIKNPYPNALKRVRHIDGDIRNNKADNLKWCKTVTPKKFSKSEDTDGIELIAEDEVFAVVKVDEVVYRWYLISNYGRLYSKMTKKFMSSKIDFHGYMAYTLRRNKKKKCVTAHILVANAFVKNPNPEKFNMINHIDENRTNNYYINLEWCDNAYNIQYNDALYKKKIRAVKQWREDGRLFTVHANMTEAARFMGVSMSAIRGWCNKGKMYRGFRWERVG